MRDRSGQGRPDRAQKQPRVARRGGRPGMRAARGRSRGRSTGHQGDPEQPRCKGLHMPGRPGVARRGGRPGTYASRGRSAGRRGGQGGDPRQVGGTVDRRSGLLGAGPSGRRSPCFAPWTCWASARRAGAEFALALGCRAEGRSRRRRGDARGCSEGQKAEGSEGHERRGGPEQGYARPVQGGCGVAAAGCGGRGAATGKPRDGRRAAALRAHRLGLVDPTRGSGGFAPVPVRREEEDPERCHRSRRGGRHPFAPGSAGTGATRRLGAGPGVVRGGVSWERRGAEGSGGRACVRGRRKAGSRAEKEGRTREIPLGGGGKAPGYGAG